MATLSGSGLAMFLVLLQLSRSGNRENVWLSQSQAHQRFGLSSDTRTTGLRELAELELVHVQRMVVDDNIFDFRRLRNTYTLNRQALGLHPDEVSAHDRVR